MPKSKPILLGHLSFPKQSDALEYFRALLARISIGTVLAGNDYAEVEALLSGHPRAQEKIGSGIEALTVDAAEISGKCFHVVRTDGSRENFSLKKCISGDPSPFTSFSAACRHVVEDELAEFKKTDDYKKILMTYGLSEESVEAARKADTASLCAGE